jgi:hypothetical protein
MGLSMPNLTHWLIGQGLAFFILVIFGLVVKLILERKLNREVSVVKLILERKLNREVSMWQFFIPMLVGFTFSLIVQYILIFGQ